MNYQNLVLGALSNDAFVMVNKKLARRIGFVPSGMLGELLATFRMVEQGVKGYDFYKGGEDGQWFYLTQPTVESRLGIKRSEHDAAIKKLVKETLIWKKQKGLPARSHYLINWERIAELMAEDSSENGSESSPKDTEKGSEPLPQSDVPKPTSLSGRNVHPRSDKTYKLDVTKPTTIITSNNNDLKTTINNNIDDDDKGEFGDSKFGINNYSFKEFVNYFRENHPTAFDDQMFSRIYHQMEIQGLDIITYQEAERQAKRMQSFGLDKINDYPAYFVGGILINRRSKQGALEERKLLEARKALLDQQKQREEIAAATPKPFYNWLEQN